MKFRLSGGVKRKIARNLSKLSLRNVFKSKQSKQVLSLVIVAGLLFDTTSTKALASGVDNQALNSYSVENSHIEFSDKTHALEITAPKQIAFNIGESRVDEQARQAAEAAAKKAAANTATLSVATVTSSTPTDVDLATKRALAQSAAAAYGIPWQVLEAVWQVESGKAWITSVTSYAGAQGPAQFMPGTWNHYKVDGNSDGLMQINNAQDAVYAAAKLLAANGAAEGDVHSALLAYNHAEWYVQKVLNIAREIGYQG